MIYDNVAKTIPVDGRKEPKPVPHETERVQTIALLKRIDGLASEAVDMAMQIRTALYGYRLEEQKEGINRDPCCIEEEILQIGHKVGHLTSVLKDMIDSIGC